MTAPQTSTSDASLEPSAEHCKFAALTDLTWGHNDCRLWLQWVLLYGPARAS